MPSLRVKLPGSLSSVIYSFCKAHLQQQRTTTTLPPAKTVNFLCTRAVSVYACDMQMRWKLIKQEDPVSILDEASCEFSAFSVLFCSLPEEKKSIRANGGQFVFGFAWGGFADYEKNCFICFSGFAAVINGKRWGRRGEAEKISEDFLVLYRHVSICEAKSMFNQRESKRKTKIISIRIYPIHSMKLSKSGRGPETHFNFPRFAFRSSDRDAFFCVWIKIKNGHEPFSSSYPTLNASQTQSRDCFSLDAVASQNTFRFSELDSGASRVSSFA